MVTSTFRTLDTTSLSKTRNLEYPQAGNVQKFVRGHGSHPGGNNPSLVPVATAKSRVKFLAVAMLLRWRESLAQNIARYYYSSASNRQFLSELCKVSNSSTKREAFGKYFKGGGNSVAR